ncbi:MAG TPA: hypothetical protein VIY49_37055 [Bryobacteraceae bacterium]
MIKTDVTQPDGTKVSYVHDSSSITVTVTYADATEATLSFP